ncbi:hypothetical protein, partial [Vibrio vulnificus]|uniref:hypothetical protein n=1 Tax=Vibrio vulnificus TaxID=672 RepID=UPI0019DC20A3
MTVSREQVDTCLLDELREELLAPEAVAELQAAVMDLLADENRSRASTEDTMRKRIKELQSEIARLVDAIAVIG